MLPMNEKLMKEAVDGYFERCAQAGKPPTPSGLALALNVRTSALTDERLSVEQRRVIDRAMQRMEASVMEMLVERGGVKGLENLLERVSEGEKAGKRKEEIRHLTDAEIEERLKKVAVKIEEMLERAAKQDGRRGREVKAEG